MLRTISTAGGGRGMILKKGYSRIIWMYVSVKMLIHLSGLFGQERRAKIPLKSPATPTRPYQPTALAVGLANKNRMFINRFNGFSAY